MRFSRSKVMNISRALGDAMLLALTARPAGALLTTPTIRLASAAPAVIGPNTVPADFTESAFTGYAAVAVTTWVGPVLLTPNLAAIIATVDFLAGDPTTIPENAVAMYVTEAGATPVIFYDGEIFEDPASFGVPGDFLTYDLIFVMPLKASTGQ